jgi:hypothetical protein
MQLGVDAGHGRGIGLIVVVDELDRAPSSPPLALVSSSQIFMPSSACLPAPESGPVSAMEKPILIGSCALAGTENAKEHRGDRAKPAARP